MEEIQSYMIVRIATDESGNRISMPELKSGHRSRCSGDERMTRDVLRNEYPWQQPYQNAVLETDNEKLKQSISYAEWIIDLRLNEGGEMSPDECKQIARTLTALSVLKTERIAGDSPGL